MNFTLAGLHCFGAQLREAELWEALDNGCLKEPCHGEDRRHGMGFSCPKHSS